MAGRRVDLWARPMADCLADHWVPLTAVSLVEQMVGKLVESMAGLRDLMKADWLAMLVDSSVYCSVDWWECIPMLAASSRSLNRTKLFDYLSEHLVSSPN